MDFLGEMVNRDTPNPHLFQDNRIPIVGMAGNFRCVTELRHRRKREDCYTHSKCSDHSLNIDAVGENALLGVSLRPDAPCPLCIDHDHPAIISFCR